MCKGLYDAAGPSRGLHLVTHDVPSILMALGSDVFSLLRFNCQKILKINCAFCGIFSVFSAKCCDLKSLFFSVFD